jgi:hypothetical protein
MNDNDHSSQTVFLPRQFVFSSGNRHRNGHSFSSSSPALRAASAGPSAVRPDGLLDLRDSLPDTAVVHRDASVDGERSAARMWQDKRRFRPPRSGSRQPAAVRHPLRAETLNTKNTSSQPVTVHKRNKQKLTLWVDPIDIEKLRLKAKKVDASMSSIGAEAIHKALHHEADIDYTITLKPLIEATINKRMADRDNHLALLLVRASIAIEQTRNIAVNVLGRQPAKNSNVLTPDVLNDILDRSLDDAKKKLTNRSPELKALIKELNSYLLDQEKGEE